MDTMDTFLIISVDLSMRFSFENEKQSPAFCLNKSLFGPLPQIRPLFWECLLTFSGVSTLPLTVFMRVRVRTEGEERHD